MLKRLIKNKLLKDKKRKRELRFKLREELIYYINFNNNRERLYVSNSIKVEIFQLAYNR